MIITLPLQPQDEAKLVALARAKGVSTDTLASVIDEAPFFADTFYWIAVTNRRK